MRKVWIVAFNGFDYDHPEILQICSSKEIAIEFLKKYNEDNPPLFPWNGCGMAEITLDIPFEIKGPA